MPGIRHRISYNAASRLGGRAAGGAVSLVALHVATRYFGPEQWGPIVAALAYVAIFSSISDFGMLTVASRDMAVPGADAGSVYGAALVGVPLVVVPAVALAVLGDLALFGDHRVIRTLVLVLLASVPLSAVWLVSCSVLVARSRNDVRALLDVTSSLLVLGAVLLVAGLHLDGRTYLVCIVVGYAVTACSAVWLARRHVRPSFGEAGAGARSLVRRSLPVGLASGSNALYGQVDTLLVALLASSRALASFGVASQLAGFVVAVPAMLMTATTPHYMAKGDAARRELLQRAFDTLVRGGAAVLVVAVVCAAAVVGAVAGARYEDGATALTLLLGAASLAFPSAVLAHGLVLAGGEKRLLGIVAAALAVNVAGNLVAVPLAGITGAASVLVASEVVVLAMVGRAFRTTTGYLPSIGRAVEAYAAALAVAAAAVAAHLEWGLQPGHGLAVVPDAVAGVVAYALLCCVLRGASAAWKGGRHAHAR
jgi:O-antigen/teichoic acid export membrane protein